MADWLLCCYQLRATHLQNILELVWQSAPVLLAVSKLDEVAVGVVGAKLHQLGDRVRGSAVLQLLLRYVCVLFCCP